MIEQNSVQYNKKDNKTINTSYILIKKVTYFNSVRPTVVSNFGSALSNSGSGSNFAGMANQVVKIRSAEIASCMKCPLCDRLYREATTISECLHTCKFFSLSYVYIYVFVL